ncbi:uncharacterized protein M421DRAFT_375731 [Didymella exigua CBS 183.55]|uniref:Uncharacterized protein n=1 Tax=Didymella exigua CBS 183.55 TaxID=1150837 RepID=A0A6A5RPZ6_9PLEO|nr:uncharacterized protein M421DRAFT_375731 [Didymella exigua CBS 183.55]KAF1930511.1 hypothetical protein M421DRAFT_375731 [Didymella exigua CBS 183.55]
MLAIETTQPPPLFRKTSLFRRFTRKDRPLEISSPIIASPHQWNTTPPQSPRSPRNLAHRPPEPQLERVAEMAPALPPLSITPAQKPRAFVTHIRVDSGSFPTLPTSQHFTTHPSPPPSPEPQHRCSPTQPRTDTPSRVPRSAHPSSPFPHSTCIGAWDIFLPPAQVHALYAGALSAAAPGWFVFSEGPDGNGKLKVHFHRARTGTKVAELFVVVDLKGAGAGKIVGIKWDAGGMGEWEAKRVVRGACRGALGIELEGELF